jgi:hypothetical protein
VHKTKFYGDEVAFRVVTQACEVTYWELVTKQTARYAALFL